MNKKPISILIIAVLAISMFAMLTPKASATGEWIIGSLSIDDSNFARCYDYTYEQANDGRSSNDVYDTAYLTAELPAYTDGLSDGATMQARLHKVLRIDGGVVANGLELAIPAEGPYPTGYIIIGRTNGVVWVNDESFQYSYWGGNYINFAYDLSWDSICYGYDIFPNYWSPSDFANDIPGHGWAGHTYEVSFAIEWFQQNWWGGWDKVGATADIPDDTNRHAFSVSTTHSDNGWESWTFLIPDDEIHFACSTQWTNTYGSASISNPYEAQYRTPDGNYATFLAASSGATARASYWIGGPGSGTVWIYGDSMQSPFSRFLVYVSSDNYNWRLSSEQLIYNNGDRWINCGTPSGTYSFVLVIAYDSGSNSYMKINCINCGGHY